MAKGFHITANIRSTISNWVSGLNDLRNRLDSIFSAIKWGTFEIDPFGQNALTFTVTGANTLRYIKFFNICFILAESVGTTGGVADPDLTLALPFPLAEGSSMHIPFVAYCYDTTVQMGFGYIAGLTGDKSLLYVRKYDSANWGLGVNRYFRVAGFYEVD